MKGPVTRSRKWKLLYPQQRAERNRTNLSERSTRSGLWTQLWQEAERAPPGSHQMSLGGRGETEPVGLSAIHEGGVELRGVHAQERGQGDGNVKKLDKWEVPGQSLGHPPSPAVEVVMVLQGRDKQHDDPESSNLHIVPPSDSKSVVEIHEQYRWTCLVL